MKNSTWRLPHVQVLIHYRSACWGVQQGPSPNNRCRSTATIMRGRLMTIVYRFLEPVGGVQGRKDVICTETTWEYVCANASPPTVLTRSQVRLLASVAVFGKRVTLWARFSLPCIALWKAMASFCRLFYDYLKFAHVIERRTLVLRTWAVTNFSIEFHDPYLESRSATP